MSIYSGTAGLPHPVWQEAGQCRTGRGERLLKALLTAHVGSVPFAIPGCEGEPLATTNNIRTKDRRRRRRALPVEVSCARLDTTTRPPAAAAAAEDIPACACGSAAAPSSPRWYALKSTSSSSSSSSSSFCWASTLRAPGGGGAAGALAGAGLRGGSGESRRTGRPPAASGSIAGMEPASSASSSCRLHSGTSFSALRLFRAENMGGRRGQR